MQTRVLIRVMHHRYRDLCTYQVDVGAKFRDEADIAAVTAAEVNKAKAKYGETADIRVETREVA